jgi:DNA-binding MarR family transcriptional regulator
MNPKVDPFELPELDKIIHSPYRLNIMTYLYVVEWGDATYLQKQTGMTWGNLSTHLSKLEAAGYVSIEKTFVGKKPSTVIRLTDAGRSAFETYKERLKDYLKMTDPS